MKKLVVSLSMIMMISLAILLVGCGSSSDEDGDSSAVKELRFSSMAVEGDLAYDICQGICDEINEKSDTMHVTFYPADQLGDFSTVFPELMNGTIDFAECSFPDTYDPMTTCALLPYLVTNYDDLVKVLDPDGFIYKTTGEACEKLGVDFLGANVDGLTGVATSKPIINELDPNKDKGVVIRTSSTKVFKMSAECLGFRCSELPYSEVFSSMQSGVVDGCIAAPPAATYTDLGDAFTYWYEYKMVPEMTGLLASHKVMETLTEEEQAIVKEAFYNGSLKSYEGSKAHNEEYLQIMKDKGYTVTEFTDEQLEVFAKNARENWWPKLVDTFGQDFFDQLNEELDRLGI
ncbi:MAG: TRAP transporter substrate-binding protein DctP [Firmicutes bacterium]|nr:TRAP transporter substrate-binding protein DctP [Bacillota bacterium]